MIEVVEMVLTALSKEEDPLRKICSSSAYFNPLVWLYDELRKNKDVVPLSELPKETKLEYWNLAVSERPERPRYVHIFICQAIHAFKTINQ